jgi:hypothetical protein
MQLLSRKKKDGTQTRVRQGVAAGSLLLVLLGSPMSNAFADVKIVEPGQAAIGMTNGDWGAAWQQWIQDIPADVNPAFDNTGENCAQGQSSGPVFFLVGAFTDEVPETPLISEVERDCTMPANRHIFFPILNVASDTIEGDFFGATEAAQRQLAGFYADLIDVGSLKVTVDGKEVKKLGEFRAQSPAYHFFLPGPDDQGNPTNMWGLDPVNADGYFGVADGYYVMLKPLSQGSHTVRFEGAFVSDGEVLFGLDVTYNLTVE